MNSVQIQVSDCSTKTITNINKNNIIKRFITSLSGYDEAHGVAVVLEKKIINKLRQAISSTSTLARC